MSPSANDTIRLRILQVALKLIAAQGFEGTTVRQICEEASVNVAMVSYYFGGKDKVFEAFFEEWFPKAKWEEMKSQQEDPLAGLSRMVLEIASFTISQKELSRIVEQELYMETPRRQIVYAYLQPVWTMVKELLIEGKKQGIFHFESLSHTLLIVHSAILAHKRSKTLNGLVLDDFSESDESTFPETALDFVLKGLGVPHPVGQK